MGGDVHIRPAPEIKPLNMRYTKYIQRSKRCGGTERHTDSEMSCIQIRTFDYIDFKLINNIIVKSI